MDMNLILGKTMKNIVEGLIIAGCLFFSITAQATDFTMTSDSILDEGLIPTKYTCDGKNISPHLAWTKPPAKTKSFALITTGNDIPGKTSYHWIIYNIPEATKTLPEDVKLSSGMQIAKNSWDMENYRGPCGPRGSTLVYIFTLYALDSKLQLPPHTDATGVLNAMQKHIIAKVSINSTYNRWASAEN